MGVALGRRVAVAVGVAEGVTVAAGAVCPDRNIENSQAIRIPSTNPTTNPILSQNQRRSLGPVGATIGIRGDCGNGVTFLSILLVISWVAVLSNPFRTKQAYHDPPPPPPNHPPENPPPLLPELDGLEAIALETELEKLFILEAKLRAWKVPTP